MTDDGTWLNDLERLQRLKDAGALSAVEFKEEKEKLLVGRSLADHAPWSAPPPLAPKPVAVGKPEPRRGVILSALAIIIILAGSLFLWVSNVRAPPPDSTVERPVVALPSSEPPAAPSEPAPEAPVKAPDPVAELRDAGWAEGSPDGDGCLLERISPTGRGLNHVFIYSPGPNGLYELSFSSARHTRDDMGTPSSEPPAWMTDQLALVIDGVRVPAEMQTHFGKFWEVELPLTRENHRLLVGARTIALFHGDEEIASERIANNAASTAALQRCLRPR